jgi:uncharacterized protein (DUF433 family)
MKQLITISPNVQSGIPVFFNTRVPVKNLFDYLKGGDSLEDFLEDFPSVTKEQVQAILKLAENAVTLNYYDNEVIA